MLLTISYFSRFLTILSSYLTSIINYGDVIYYLANRNVNVGQAENAHVQVQYLILVRSILNFHKAHEKQARRNRHFWLIDESFAGTANRSHRLAPAMGGVTPFMELAAARSKLFPQLRKRVSEL